MSDNQAEYKTGQDMTATEVSQRTAEQGHNIELIHNKIELLENRFTSGEKNIAMLALDITDLQNKPPPEPQFDQLYAALAKAQGDIAAAEASQENTHFDYRYANLQDCLDACRKPLSESELAVIQLPTIDDGVVYMRTILGHSSGQSIEQTMTMKPEKDGPQAIGSVITYLRRYMLCAIVGIGQQDDDANLATADPDDYERLTPEQIDEILVLADKHFGKDADAKVNRMLDKAFQVTAVGDIPATHFDSAINLLNNQAKREKAQAKKPKPDTTESKEEPGADG